MKKSDTSSLSSDNTSIMIVRSPPRRTTAVQDANHTTRGTRSPHHYQLEDEEQDEEIAQQARTELHHAQGRQHTDESCRSISTGGGRIQEANKLLVVVLETIEAVLLLCEADDDDAHS